MSAPASARPAAPSYAAVLRVPHARRTFATALVGRLSYGIVPLSLLLATQRATGSYTASGAVLSLYGAAVVLLTPRRASLVDRHGARRALLPLGVAHGLLLGVLAALTWRPGTPVPLIGGAAVLAGACAPPLGPTMRAVWSELLADRDLLRRAYSLDGVAEELLFVSGPALVGVLVAWTVPAAGVLSGAVLMIAGTAAFVTSPAMTGPRPRTGDEGRLGGVRSLVAPVAVAAGAGLAVSGVELLVLAHVGEHSGDTDLVPWVLGALSVGSALGGLANGAIDWRGPAGPRLAGLAAALGLTIAAAGLAPGVLTLTAAMTCAGAFIAPALTTAYLLADESAPASDRTRAGAWVNMAVNAGSSAGGVSTGALVGHLPLPLCFALTGATALASAGVALASGRRREPAAV
ncbi:MFS transporter [Streptomyces sp. NPDC046860]|uniref:MFS transporter n=1 Tax=Streptomyces sp. NPDC046860 TaxID=3154495 RepID=UPI0033F63069